MAVLAPLPQGFLVIHALQTSFRVQLRTFRNGHAFRFPDWVRKGRELMIHLKVRILLYLLGLVFAPLCSAAEAPLTLTVATTAASLYAREDHESKIVATLEKGEMLKPG
jgi:hypothetical protein